MSTAVDDDENNGTRTMDECLDGGKGVEDNFNTSDIDKTEQEHNFPKDEHTFDDKRVQNGATCSICACRPTKTGKNSSSLRLGGVELCNTPLSKSTVRAGFKFRWNSSPRGGVINQGIHFYAFIGMRI